MLTSLPSKLTSPSHTCRPYLFRSTWKLPIFGAAEPRFTSVTAAPAMNQGNLAVRNARVTDSWITSVSFGPSVSSHMLVVVQLIHPAVSTGEMGVHRRALCAICIRFAVFASFRR